MNESVVADGSVLGCEFSGSTVSRGFSWGRLVLGFFLALASVEKEHCRPSIAGAHVFTEVCLPASSFSSEVGTEGAAKSLVCAYVTSSSGFVLLLLEFLQLVVPERDHASVKGSRNKSLFHAQVDGVRCRVNKGVELRKGWEKKKGLCTHFELVKIYTQRQTQWFFPAGHLFKYESRIRDFSAIGSRASIVIHEPYLPLEKNVQ